MWKILEHKSVRKKLNLLPIPILERYEKWKDIVEISGPEGLKLIKGFNDEALYGKWKGFRSSRLNKQYRVVYKIENDVLLVRVRKVTLHDYRRK